MLQEMSDVTLVRRDDIPSMRTVVVDGVEHWLGHVKDFTKNAPLTQFLPKDNRISMAWVRLEAGERLDAHIHPVESMIVMCEGGARTLGDVRETMNAGDILLVPPGKLHGFIGMPPSGFWGLSIQFDSRGLYEDIADPWATFTDELEQQNGAGSVVEQLLLKNEEYMERFDKHRLFAMVRNGLLSDAAAKRRFLDCFQVWSNYFQKMVLMRAVTARQKGFDDLAWQHLYEELGHNQSLAKSRDDLQTVFDPLLEATCSWFASKMEHIGEAEKVVLSHVVVEASATYFYKHVQPILAQTDVKDHFDVHSVVDEDHVEMGYAFLRTLSIEDGHSLFEIQHQGWAMLMAVMARIADLTVHHTGGGAEASAEKDRSDAVADAVAV
ncbi:cupin domain-containing protein [Chromobacterium piscinae]|uniref:Cupin domain-containing protein n=3 Tax=Chromobacterium piscinae TaxID=686831 RepID=A0ABV0H9Y6_9NEIS|nr:cupin domain-containing protein [Chromobacterium piscinae]MBX9296629.1 hypothetical protein [Chromobacterium vaccinii]MBX9359542.1 hypothetical protein [Chromobacterium vaccinii]MCD4504924.1 hypothetical protein [Chromobacterium piscinae]